MSVALNPYLNFRGQARAAMEFYHEVFGGSLNLGSFGEMGMPQDGEENDWVMHGDLEGANGLRLMGADVPGSMDLGPNGMVSLSGTDEELISTCWVKLSEGGEVWAPFEKAPWGDTFGGCVDKFGVRWAVDLYGCPEA